MNPLLLNAARAFAMVSFADGRLSPKEAQRFLRLAEQEPALSHFGHLQASDAWAVASNEVHEAQSFGGALLLIRTEITDEPGKTLMMRVAQAAVVADGKLEAQENKAVSSLAEALGLDPETPELRTRMRVAVWSREGGMRPRAGTHPVTLEPPRVVEILALARHHDEALRETRQDLFRAETKLNFERVWRWPIRAACVALGVVGMAAWQNDEVRANSLAFYEGVFGQLRQSGVETLISLVIAGAVIWLGVFLVRRWLRGPTPERQARKLMEGFARSDGVASYVFAGQNTLDHVDNPDDEAAAIGALTRPENKRFRQRRLTQDNRPLASSLTRILNRHIDSSGQLQQHEPAADDLRDAAAPVYRN